LFIYICNDEIQRHEERTARLTDRSKTKIPGPHLCFRLGARHHLRGSMTKQLRAAVAAMLVLSTVSMQAQTGTPARTAKVVKKKAETPLERTLRELREQMQAQQAQIDELKRQLADRDARLSTASQDAQAASASAAAAASQAQNALTAAQS